MTERRAVHAVISPAVQDIIVESFSDQLHYGPADFADGNDPVFRREAQVTLTAAKAANEAGRLTHSHLLLATVFDALQQSDLTEVRNRLVGVASVAVDWIESIDRRSAS